MENKKETVCAVVVTYNRKLLSEYLEAIRRQIRPIQGIYLIDSASINGTPELLLEEGYIKDYDIEDAVKSFGGF